ncbi:serine hydrolase [Brevibacillus sp. NRS-1366]|uniref:serine hydrolase n=1 Tax=Brevibacillus sp. NRS-1366 TaxID=3233899 RepID=UPI003D22FFE7
MTDIPDRLEEYLAEYERSWPLSGTVLVAQHGEVLFRKAYGHANIEHRLSNSIDTKFRIWSITKSFTAMAVMMLYEQKLLHFEDRLNRFLPEWNHLQDITLAHLLSHTSGLTNYTYLPEYNKRLNKLRLSQQDVLNLFVNNPLAFTPGTSFAYNNSGYFLLGVVIEKITGSTFENYITDHILIPLGMKNTGIDNNQKVIHNMSSAYNSSWEDFIPCEYIDMSSIFSAGSMYSTVDDLFIWDQALYSEKLVSKPTMDMALQTTCCNYGFGWFLDNHHNRRRIYHGGAYRGFRSEMHRYPDDQATVIMSTNYDFVPIRKLTESLTALLFGGHVPMQRRPNEVPLEKRVYETYMGTYEGFGCTATVDRKGEQLYFLWNEEAVIPFYPTSETTFHHTWYDWDCTFTRNDKGEISFLGMKKGKPGE